MTGPGRYLLKPGLSARLAPGSAERLVERYGATALYLTDHAAEPPWTRLDRDVRLQAPSSFLHTWHGDQGLMAALGAGKVPVLADGGHHWLYAGLVSGAIARLQGESPAEQPLLVDFALRWLHDRQTDGGLGDPEEFFARPIPTEERHARSSWFDRYLATVVAYGHAGLLPDLERWGLPAVAKTYFMLRALQGHYLGVKPESIHYQRGGNLLETTEALVAGAHELSQIRVVYANGLQIHVNGAREEDWVIEDDDATSYRLPPASFLARGPGDLLVYSADAGGGRIDYAACPEYLYCDTRGARMTMGPLTLDGAAVLTHEDWVIDIYPPRLRERPRGRALPHLEGPPHAAPAGARLPGRRRGGGGGIRKRRGREHLPRAPGRHLPLPHHPSRVDGRAGEVRSPAGESTLPSPRPAATAEEALFLATCRGRVSPRRPVWLMRQAGRILAPYRELKERVGSMEGLFRDPAVAAEVTLMPVEMLGVDAAILFADIFTPVDPMGCAVAFSPAPVLEFHVAGAADLARLREIDSERDLGHVGETIGRVRDRLPAEVPLIGFAGAPFTLATYMAESGPRSREFSGCRRLLQSDPATALGLLDLLAEVAIDYLSMQVRAGAQALQLFDTCVGGLSPARLRGPRPAAAAAHLPPPEGAGSAVDLLRQQRRPPGGRPRPRRRRRPLPGLAHRPGRPLPSLAGPRPPAGKPRPGAALRPPRPGGGGGPAPACWPPRGFPTCSTWDTESIPRPPYASVVRLVETVKRYGRES